MVCGLGGVGSWALEMLVRAPNIPKIVTADINEDYGFRRTNSAQCGAAQLGFYPNCRFHKLDARDVEQTAELLHDVDPTVIVSSMSLVPWVAPTWLPEEKYELFLDAGGANLLPCHLPLQYNLMQAVERADIDPLVVQTSFPDAILPILHKAEVRPPDIGIGNLDNMVPTIRLQVARKMNRNIRNVRVYLVAHHVNNVWFTRLRPGGPPPYKMKIYVDDKDVTNNFDTEELMRNTAAKEGGWRLGGKQADFLTASSAVKHALALFNDADLFTHSPGSKGLVGGYPIHLKAGEVELALPEGISKEEAIEINEKGQRRDGIEEIKEDGTVVFTDECVELRSKTINYKHKSMAIDEAEDMAEELLAKLKEHSE